MNKDKALDSNYLTNDAFINKTYEYEQPKENKFVILDINDKGATMIFTHLFDEKIKGKFKIKLEPYDEQTN